jgi:hypothetical protein
MIATIEGLHYSSAPNLPPQAIVWGAPMHVDQYLRKTPITRP